MAVLSGNYLKFLDEQYRIGNAIVSDQEFDQLERNLIRINPKSNYFKEKNKLRLATIKNSNYKEFLNTLLKNTRLIIQPKIDGCAIAIQYINGKFDKAITRKGSNVTNKIKKIKNVPDHVPLKRDFQVRGELYAPNQTPRFSQRITSKYIETNQGVGEDFAFCCFEILNSRLNQNKALKYLEKCGFSTPPCYFTNLTSQVESFRKEWLKGNLFSSYPTDGIIIKVNSKKLQLLREKNSFKLEDWQYAIKY